MPIDKKGGTDLLKMTSHNPCELCTTAAKTGGEAIESKGLSRKSLFFLYFFLAGGIFSKFFLLILTKVDFIYCLGSRHFAYFSTQLANKMRRTGVSLCQMRSRERLRKPCKRGG